MSLWKTTAKVATAVICLGGSVQALATSDLDSYNSNWQTLMNTQAADQLKHYYDDQSLLGQYPYDASKNLVGLESIKGMFSNGPFKLAGLKVAVDSIALSESPKTALLLKQWKIDFDKGGFQGLALEVIEQSNDQWVRRIDLGAGGLSSAADFAKQDTEADNSAFDNFAAQLQATQNAERQNLSSDAASLNVAKISAVDNLLSVEQLDSGLLISKVTSPSGDYLTFNALHKTDGSWKLAAQLVEKL